MLLSSNGLHAWFQACLRSSIKQHYHHTIIVHHLKPICCIRSVVGPIYCKASLSATAHAAGAVLGSMWAA